MVTDAEPGNNAEEDAEGAVEQKQVKRVVTLIYGEQTVILEGPDDLKTMAELASYFWLLTAPPNKATFGFSAGSSLVTELAEPFYEDRSGGTGGDEMA